MDIKKCECCGNEFKPHRKTQRYCSRTCGQCNKRQEKIDVVCEYTGCTNNFYKLPNSQKRFCSRKCQVEWQKYSMCGENNPNYGNRNPGMFKHTEEAKEKIREKVLKSWKTKSRHKKHQEFFDRHRLEDGSMDWMDSEFREKISKSNIRRLKDNEETFAYNSCKKGYVLNETTNGNEFFHSSWEELRMEELNTNKKVKKWTKKHGISIEYLYNNNVHIYLPDFYIEYEDGEIIIEEVKGYIENEDKFLCKMRALKSYCKKNEIKFKINFFKNDKKYDFLLKKI